MKSKIGIYVVCDREAGNVICAVDSYEEGLRMIETFEAEDKTNDVYAPAFYELDVFFGLKDIRRARCFTQESLADKSGVSLQIIQDCEKGVEYIQRADVLNLRRLAYALDCSIEDLISEKISYVDD